MAVKKLPSHPRQYFFAKTLELYEQIIVEDSSASDTQLIRLLSMRGLLEELAARDRERHAPRPRLVAAVPIRAASLAASGQMDGAA